MSGRKRVKNQKFTSNKLESSGNNIFANKKRKAFAHTDIKVKLTLVIPKMQSIFNKRSVTNEGYYQRSGQTDS